MSIETVPIAQKDIPLLYSVVREEFPDLAPDAWESFVSPYLDDMLHGGLRGVMGVRTSMLNKYRGLFLYSVDTTLHHPRTLVISHAIMPQVFGSDLVADKFIESWRDLAARHDCGMVKVTLAPNIADALMSKFGETASIESVCLCLTLPSALPSRKRRQADRPH
jgi:hypothetical protein